MTDFDIALVGASDFTLELKKEFEGKCRLLFVDNAAFEGEFSSRYFPTTTFIPGTKEEKGVYGQLTTNYFRFDLISDTDVLKLLWTEQLNENGEKFSVLEKRAAQELGMANFFLVENYSLSLFSVLIQNLKFVLKSHREVKNLLFYPLPKGKNGFATLLKSMNLFFAPGEANNSLFEKYLLYSVLLKNPYKVTTEDGLSTPHETTEHLKGITYGEAWELRFEKKKVTAKILVSALPPHIYTRFGISHPFKTDYDKACYCFTPAEPINPPCGMAEELVFTDGKVCCFITNEKKGLTFFLPGSVNEAPSADMIKPVLDCLFPHITTPYNKASKN